MLARWISIFLALSVSSVVYAADVKIGVVDLERAILETSKAKTMSDELVKKFKADDEKVKKIDADLKGLKEKAEKSGDKMSKADREALVKQAKAKSQEKGELIQKIKSAEQDAWKDLRAAVDPKIKDVMQAVAQERGYTLILERQAVPFYSVGDDVTQLTTEKLNQAIK